MDASELAAACRPAVPSDDLVRGVLARGGASEYADSGTLSDAGSARHICRIYRRRVRDLARKGLIRTDAEATVADLERLEQDGLPPRVVILIEPLADGRRVYTAVLTGDPPGVRASFVHDLPDHRPRA